jgi:hypothetical protein
MSRNFLRDFFWKILSAFVYFASRRRAKVRNTIYARSLVGFGFDGLIEVTSSIALLLRLHSDADESRRSMWRRLRWAFSVSYRGSLSVCY